MCFASSKRAKREIALRNAAALGNCEAISRYIAEGVDIECLDDGPIDLVEDRPLHIAVTGGHVKVARLLLDAKANIEAKMDKGVTPLFQAARLGSLKMASLLLERRADPDNESEEQGGMSPLWVAANQAQATPDLMQMLVAASACNGDFVKLWRASRYGDIDVVEEMLAADVDVNARSSHGQTPLFQSTRKSHNAISALLLGAGAQANLCETSGWAPIHNAMQRCDDESLKMLIDAAADVNAVFKDAGATPLHLAVSQSHGKGVEALLKVSDIDVNAVTIEGETSLHVAVDFDCDEMLPLLLGSGSIDLNIVDQYGRTALHFAVSKGSVPSARQLLAARANPNTAPKDGLSPLSEAMRLGNEELVSMLRSAGGRESDEVLKVISAFQVFDTNKDGKVGKDELAHTLQEIDSATWTSGEIERLFAEMDIDSDGGVSYEEFVYWTFHASSAQKSRVSLRNYILKIDDSS
eukprot:TRINITY_DN51586_c0_g1_i1.p1 TRINITY_DN51586_c0_g1~~TRINITY_DN51586_c0_g1_i1.p1  ORF type:complete len:467 (+),score=89.14 TRINITY_DN51586_c0_g1_i1:57-1457(+)